MEKPRSLGWFCPGWLQVVKLIILKAAMSHFPTPHPLHLEPSPVPPLCHGSAGSLAAEAHKSLWRFLRTWVGLTASLSRLGCFFSIAYRWKISFFPNTLSKCTPWHGKEANPASKALVSPEDWTPRPFAAQQVGHWLATRLPSLQSSTFHPQISRTKMLRLYLFWDRQKSKL